MFGFEEDFSFHQSLSHTNNDSVSSGIHLCGQYLFINLELVVVNPKIGVCKLKTILKLCRVRDVRLILSRNVSEVSCWNLLGCESCKMVRIELN